MDLDSRERTVKCLGYCSKSGVIAVVFLEAVWNLEIRGVSADIIDNVVRDRQYVWSTEERVAEHRNVSFDQSHAFNSKFYKKVQPMRFSSNELGFEEKAS